MSSRKSFLPCLFACLAILALGFNASPTDAASASPNAFGKPTADNWNPGNNLNPNTATGYPGVIRGTRPTGWLDQTRSEILARNGIVTTSEPLAAQAGLKILQDGGNAVDAAVATMAMLALVEPQSTGLGAEMFAIVWDAKTKQLYQISANGPSPKNYTPATFAANGFDLSKQPNGTYRNPPTSGIFAAPVSGSVDGWDKLLKRFGTLTFKEVLEPARKYAFEGFPVHEVLASSFRSSRSSLCAQSAPFDQDTAAVYCRDGKVPGLYESFKNPDMGHAFEVLQKKGVDAFYKGEIAQAIVNKANSIVPGLWSLDDLANYQARWEPPVRTKYHGYDIWETPPPSQGWAALEMLNILEQCAEKGVGKFNTPYDLAALGHSTSLFTHIEVEAKKLAYSDLLRYNADPDFFPQMYNLLNNYFLDKSYAGSLCPLIEIDPPKARPADVKGNLPGGTIYGASADRWGNMVSFVYSVYTSWGSMVTIPGYGFQLSSRGAMFTFDPAHPNTLAGGKRPFITIIAGFITKDGEPVMAFGNMGGSTQPLGHAQHIVNMIDLGFNVQATGDAARWDHSQSATSDRLSLDYYLYDRVNADLTAWGHSTQRSRGLGGGYQGILFERDYSLPEPIVPGGRGGKGVAHQDPVNGTYRAGSELRKDGCAVGW
jgi:gamma-glutamyltranspeptidase/glutathione hydrolase